MHGLDEESRALVARTLERFVADHYDPAVRLKRLHAAPVDHRLHWPLLADIGLLGLLLDPEAGGLGGGATDLCSALQILAPGLVLEPVAQALVGNALFAQAWPGDATLDKAMGGKHLLVAANLALADSVAVHHTAEGLRLRGRLHTVPYAAQADEWLLAVHGADGRPTLLRLPAGTPGVSLHPVRLMDARPAADIVFDEVALPGAAAADTDGLQRAADLCLVAHCADSVGVMAHALAMTRDQLRTRIQFGVALGTFQALQHRLADMQMLWLEARALLQAWSEALDENATGPRLQALRRALPRVICNAASLIGQEAIQMHGGMGLTEELVISHCNARLQVNASLLAPWIASGVHEDVAQDTTSAGFGETAFRAEVRAFVAAELDPATRHKVENGLYLSKHDYVNWQQALYRRGWFGATWPGAAGGKDWSVLQEHAFLQECAIGAAPMLIPYGVNMVGPVLYTFGSEEQKRRWLPGILSSETWWCQGYSEPNAGSDLASLVTGAVRDGDHYVVNGTKLWTTEAHWADMMHCLVRTERTARKQEGITFLLIDMKTPGITVEPIVTLDGVHHTNQVFFDNVRVPVENVVGREGEGWKLAKFLLSRERSFIADTGNKLRMIEQMRRSVRHYAPRLSAPARAVLAERLAGLEAELVALVELERAYLHAWAAGQDDGIGASVLKVRGSELLQRMSEFWRDSLGSYGACYDPAQRQGGDGLSAPEPWVQAATVNYQYLYGRCWSVFGGANEVQRNLIAGSLLRG